MDLEDELKRLFQDERLDVRVAADADRTVVAGARRVRRRRIALVSAAGVLSAVLVAAGTLALTRGPAQTETANQPPLPITTSVTSSAAEIAPGPEEPTPAPPSITGKPTTTPETKASSTTTSPRTARTTEPSDATPLGPTGYGFLRLGMTEAQLVATGQVAPVSSSGTCARYTINSQTGSRLEVSAKRGLVVIDPGVKFHTPEGITEGATQAEVKAQYPDYDSQVSPAIVRVPGNSAAWYYIYLGADTRRIGEIILVGNQSECASK